MIGVTKILGKSAAGYAAYMTDLAAAGDYYVTKDGSPGEAPGVWLGMSEEELAEIGVDSSSGVSKKELESLMRGVDPITGEELRRVGPDGTRVAAIDVTWSVPKSVSVIWATAEPEMRAAIEAAFMGAVAEGVDYIGHEPIVRERNGGPQQHVKAAGVAAAAFRHSTARLTGAEDNGVPDPQLHAHVLLLGAKRTDGTFAAIDSYAIMQRQWELEGRVMGDLAGRLTALGYSIERTTDGKGGVKWEVAGVSPELIKAWSRRGADIDGLKAAFRAEHHKEPTVKQVRVMALASRGKKTSMPNSDLFNVWRAKAALQGKAAAGGKPAKTKPLSAADRALQFQAELVQALTREHATFDDLKLRKVASVLMQGLLFSPAELDKQLALMKESGELVELADGRWTTKEIRALEAAAMAAAGRLVARRGGPAMSGQTLAAIVGAVEMQKDIALSAEQRAALTGIMAEGGLTLMVGQAGTGKGVVLAAAARAWQSQGREVIGMAVSGKRTVALKQELGISNVMNLAAMVKRLEVGALTLTSGHVIVVDEAVVASHPQMEAVLSAADKSGAKLVLVGDHQQLQAIGPGGLFRALAKVAPTVELTEIHRAKSIEERAAWTALRDGRTAEALAYYHRLGRLHILDTREEAQAAMAAAWNEARKGLKPSEIKMIVDSSNHDRNTLNLIAQAYRVEAGELGAERVKIGQSAEMWAHTGDHVMVGKPTYPDGERRRIENGTLAEVTGVDPVTSELTLRTEETPPRTVRLVGGDQLAGVELSNAVHVYKGIGDTVTRGLVMISWQTDKEKAYTALSRSTDATDIFVSRDDLDEEGIGGDNVDAEIAKLDKLMRRSHMKGASIEYELAAHESHVRRGRLGAAVRKILATLRPAKIDHDRLAGADEDLRLDRLENRRLGPRRVEIVQERVMMEMDEGIGGLRVVGRGEGIMEPSLRLVERTEPVSSTTAPVEPTVEPTTPTPAPVEPPVAVTAAPAPVEPAGLKVVQPHNKPPKTGGVR